MALKERISKTKDKVKKKVQEVFQPGKEPPPQIEKPEPKPEAVPEPEAKPLHEEEGITPVTPPPAGGPSTLTATDPNQYFGIPSQSLTQQVIAGITGKGEQVVITPDIAAQLEAENPVAAGVIGAALPGGPAAKGGKVASKLGKQSYTELMKQAENLFIRGDKAGSAILEKQANKLLGDAADFKLIRDKAGGLITKGSQKIAEGAGVDADTLLQKSVANIDKILKQGQIKRVQAFAAKAGVDADTLLQKSAKLEMDKGLKKAVNGINLKKLIGTVSAVGVVGAVGGWDLITNWFAMDNVIGGSEIYSRDLAKDVQFGNTDPATALKSMEESKEAFDTAVAKVEQSAKWNPIMWPSRNMILTGIEDKERIFNERIEFVRSQTQAQGAAEVLE